MHYYGGCLNSVVQSLTVILLRNVQSKTGRLYGSDDNGLVCAMIALPLPRWQMALCCSRGLGHFASVVAVERTEESD